MNITMTNRRPSAFTVIGEIADLVEVDGVLPGRLIACGLRGDDAEYIVQAVMVLNMINGAASELPDDEK